MRFLLPLLSASLFLMILFVSPMKVEAVTLDKASYTVGGAINFTSSLDDGFLLIYDVNQNVDQSQYDCGTEFADTTYPILPDDGWCALTPSESFDSIPAGSYSIIEIDQDAIPYEDCRALSYTDCKDTAGFTEEFLFTIIASVSPSGGGPVAHKPEITITTPQRGDIFAEFVEIKYVALDQNDTGGVVEKEWLGLGDAAVSIFYSETSDTRRRKLIAKDLPSAGSYEWDTTNIPDANKYRIIVEAVDNIGEVGIGVSGGFSIDHIAPVFKVQVAPLFTRGEDVDIFVQSSKFLKEPPEVKITQSGFQPVEVIMDGEGDYFEGRYVVFADYDGTAIISIKGMDAAGNIGTTVIEGKTFSINVAPPSSPIIIAPLDGDIIDTKTVTVIGNARKDTIVLLSVNGVDEYETKPDKNGDFIFEDVKIDPLSAGGVNFLSVTSRDQIGNESGGRGIRVKFNMEPELSVIFPKENNTLFATPTIRFGARDKNSDLLIFTIEASRDGGNTWNVLVDALQEEFYDWDTTKFPDGDYILRITADDGFTKTSASSKRFFVRNFLPEISFEEDRTVISKDMITVTGTAESKAKRRNLRTIVDVEYSLDQGVSWIKAQAKDGDFDSYSEEFTFNLNNLKEGIHYIIVRSKDNSNRVGEATKIVIVDFGPPPTPTHISPQTGSVFSDKDDLDSNKAGVQIQIAGKTEPNNELLVTNGKLAFKGLSDSVGNFDIEITLRERGENTIEITSIDPAGNMSKKKAILSVVYNNPPDIKFLWPREGGGLNHISEIIFEIQDRDLDSIVESSLSYRKIGRTSIYVLAQNMEGNTFILDVSDFEEGRYELILKASDGMLEDTLIREFIIDNTIPQINFEPLSENVFTEPITLEIEGGAKDNLSGLEFIEYSLNGREWFKALITDGYKDKETAFRLNYPYPLEDGRYEVTFRATDVSGNVSSVSEVQEVIVDTSSPRIGSFMLSTGPFTLFPEGKHFKVSENSEASIIISLEGDTKEAILLIGDVRVPLVKDFSLWKGSLVFPETGVFHLLITAEDDFGNQTAKKEIGTIEVSPRGRVTATTENDSLDIVTGAKLTAFVFSKEDQSWVTWQAESFGLSNPVQTDSNGQYSFLLPSGKYYLIIEKNGFQKIRSSNFEIVNPLVVAFDFTLEPRVGIRGFFEDLIDKITF